MSDDDERPSPLEVLRGVLPGALRPTTALLALGALVLGLGMVAFAAAVLDGKSQMIMAAGGLMAWGHGAVWLVTGEVQRLDSGLADLAGATWGVFFAVWGLPLWAAWALAGWLLSD